MPYNCVTSRDFRRLNLRATFGTAIAAFNMDDGFPLKSDQKCSVQRSENQLYLISDAEFKLVDKSCNNAALVLADLVCKYCVAEIWLGVPQPLITHSIDLIIFVTCNIYPAAVNKKKKKKKKMYTY